MTSARLLARNSLFNLLGQGAPLVVALFAIPVLVRGLGADRFGILALAWTAVGYFSLFDLGLGRALTQAVSAAIGAGRAAALPTLSAAALRTMAALGVAGGLLLAALAPYLAHHLFKIPDTLRGEAGWAFYLVAASLPFVLITAGCRSLLEAHQHFGAATLLRLPYAIFNFVAPLAVLPFSHSLVPIVAILVAGRVGTCIAHLVVCWRRYDFLHRRAPLHRAVVVPLLRQGGWMTVSNVISPLMVNLDRLSIGGLMSVAAVAYYATPYEMVVKLLLIPGALLGVLFPAFATTFERDRSATARLLERATRVMIVVMFPATVLLVTFAREALLVWLGADFARQSTAVVQWLAAGVFINSVGQVPFAALQGIGRADITAKLHAVEFPLYAVGIVWLASAFGLDGVAMAWTLRLAVDTAALIWFAARRLPQLDVELRGTVAVFIVLLLMLGLVATVQRVQTKLAVDAVVLVGFALIGWLRVLRAEERDMVRRWLRTFAAPAPAA